MNQITCPKCGTVINLDESDYEGIVRQVRDDQFAHEVEERAASLRREHEQALELARSQAKAELDRVVTAQKAQLQEALARSSAELQEVKARSASELQEARAAGAAALQQAQSAGAAQLAKEQSERTAELMRVRAEADARIAELSAKLESAVEERESAVKVAAQRERMVAQQDAADQKDELREQLAARDAQIASLKAQLDAGATQRDLAVTRAVTEARTTFEEERAKLARDLDAARFELSHEQEVRAAEKQQIETAHALEIEQARKSAQELIRYKDEEIERLRDMKARLSTKMVGETLEQHCETQFNQLRATAFPHAYFEKDNDASDGTKGDFIFRECDEAGNEIVSIMFEMKNENDTTATKHKNEDFFKKLDSDRKKKGCEYAVLVTLLEPESELYNAGIVDVSYRYEKMYVIRPQFFIPMITLLRNAAMNALAYKQELELVRQQNIDVTEFEEKLLGFQEGFNRNYDLASRKFQTAIDEIDATIKHLQKVKDNLISSENNLRLANDKAQGLSIRKLTWGNKTMKAKFDEAREGAERAAREGVAVEEAPGVDPDFTDSYEV
ncbi:DUF2130 domain-containing protein [Collinsella stercoris]|uniref:DUF2130 domain-containing protein n=1 Tax=Collinsella stercoris DSM 13279 TaxID=445975 RepID=B6G919_9ACTN|nr:DUF2130 domain-containing protein [Collinsella stercoris]EEA91216.1 hypothetical protein COLSTE_00560 [Collinsella stercoris DSM 13279]UEA44609.1 DUF2130 domain-containing protein [Collinsella stercoris DSM 13279]UWP10927.1 DUF2130 domain-containing protein [Collinsella stercoris]